MFLPLQAHHTFTPTLGMAAMILNHLLDCVIMHILRYRNKYEIEELAVDRMHIREQEP